MWRIEKVELLNSIEMKELSQFFIAQRELLLFT